MGECVRKNQKDKRNLKLPLYVRTAEEVVGSAHPDRERGVFT